MKRSAFIKFMRSPTARLAGTYLAIIMILSISFSFVFYHTSSQQLGRQIPPDSFFNNQAHGEAGPPPSVNHFLQQRVSEGRSALQMRLIFLNIGALLVGGVLSYGLARRSLQPIEQAMEAQSQFVSDASHELRTPLTAIQTSNEVFLRRPKVSVAEAKQVITQNTEDVKRLKALSDGLLGLARHQKASVLLSAVNLQDVVNEAMNQVVSLASKDDIAVNDEVPPLHVLADKTSLTQVLVILLDNAIKYNKPHGNIYIRASRKGRTAYLSVLDEGIGIRASDLPHIFRRFYRADTARTKTEHGGYGLGLAIARQIMHSQNGDITVASSLGQGSTFTIKLLASGTVPSKT